MSVIQPSEMTEELYRALKRSEREGLLLLPGEVSALMRNVWSIRELCCQVEEENRILELRLSENRRQATILPFRPRLNIRPVPDDGGDAA